MEIPIEKRYFKIFGKITFLTSISIISFCALNLFPRQGISLTTETSDFLLSPNCQSIPNIKMQFDALKEQISSSSDRIADCYKFLQTFVERINLHYDTTLSISESCKLLRENFQRLQISEEARNLLLQVIVLLEAHDHKEFIQIHTQNLTSIALRSFNNISYSGMWSWFGWNDSKKNVSQEIGKSVPYDYYLCALNYEYPDELIIGGIELLAGSLLVILPFPLTQAIGGIMLTDGSRRVFDGVKEVSQYNKIQQSQSLQHMD